MLELTRYETRRRARETLALTALLGLFALMIVGFYPSIEASGVDFEAYAESLPPAVQAAFNVKALTTVAGFLAVEFYQFAWMLLFGLYVAYAAGGAIAGEIESRRVELTLAAPVSRRRVVAEKYLAVLAPVLALNLLTPAVVGIGLAVIGESVPLADLLAVHALSVPYLAVCGGVGLLLSTALDRADPARRGAIAAVFMLFLVDSVTAGTDYAWIGALSPTRYYDPTAILVDSTYDLGGALLLIAGALLLVGASAALFARRDV